MTEAAIDGTGHAHLEPGCRHVHGRRRYPHDPGVEARRQAFAKSLERLARVVRVSGRIAERAVLRDAIEASIEEPGDPLLDAIDLVFAGSEHVPINIEEISWIDPAPLVEGHGLIGERDAWLTASRQPPRDPTGAEVARQAYPVDVVSPSARHVVNPAHPPDPAFDDGMGDEIPSSNPGDRSVIRKARAAAASTSRPRMSQWKSRWVTPSLLAFISRQTVSSWSCESMM